MENTLKRQNIICFKAGRKVHHIGKQNKTPDHWLIPLVNNARKHLHLKGEESSLRLGNNPKRPLQFWVCWEGGGHAFPPRGC